MFAVTVGILSKDDMSPDPTELLYEYLRDNGICNITYHPTNGYVASSICGDKTGHLIWYTGKNRKNFGVRKLISRNVHGFGEVQWEDDSSFVNISDPQCFEKILEWIKKEWPEWISGSHSE